MLIRAGEGKAEIMAAPKPGDLVIGRDYFSVKCSACGEVIPLAPNILGLSSGFSGDETVTVGCPFCGTTADYPADKVVSRPLEKLPPTAH